MIKPIFKILWTAHSALSKAFITKNIFYVLSTDVKNMVRACALFAIYDFILKS